MTPPATAAMTPNRKLRLLFAAYMAGGNATILQNLQEPIGVRTDVGAAFLPVEMDEESTRTDRAPRRRLVPGTLRNSMVTGERIRKLEKEGGRFDAAYFFQQTICMFLWRFRSRVPYVIAMDGTPLWYAKNDLWYAQPRFDPDSLGSRVRHVLTRRVYQQAFHLLPLSWSARASLIEDYGIPPECITVVPPGINLQRYVPPDRRASSAPGRPLSVLFVGADFVRKGGDLLVALAARPEFADVQFHLVTKTYRGPPAPNVHVHEDLKTNTAPMVNLFREADLFVLPTRADSHAIASLEAMAMGLPVITTPVGGVVDVVEDGRTGYLVPKDDPEAVATRIRELRADPARRIEMGLHARARVETRFDAAKIAEVVLDLLTRAAASRA